MTKLNSKGKYTFSFRWGRLRTVQIFITSVYSQYSADNFLVTFSLSLSSLLVVLGLMGCFGQGTSCLLLHFEKTKIWKKILTFFPLLWIFSRIFIVHGHKISLRYLFSSFWRKSGWVYDVITWLICIFWKLEYLWNEERYLKIVNSIFLLMQSTWLRLKMASNGKMQFSP